MEKYHLPEDIRAMYITASSFPDGVLAAHQKLHSLVPLSESPHRKYFGISFPIDGTIIYKAGAEELTAGEADKLGLEIYLIKKGEYTSVDIHNYMQNLSAISETFNELLENPRIDPNGACIEWYISDKDVKCMVRLAD
ncbi:transcriptional regulator [Emticicia sp. C21]|uniref:transcriptional regulator n=1 Tax=Emticicia sp. C21 TaxID=2302915 RepID=UPI000E3528FA|nr:transcriptional regulator [Emticicia sp. C21]RFS13778.1 transcriptional regulator [Emticicia sp. C21]